ncbi:MAG: T9SS type A sorting domain-containing protein [Bacteroidetes bacterium]|uniref:T9SS type A sorting domain-containing protein n=1 Tax=Flavobacterium sp. TaxID=239 RepID=UPI002FD9C31C|nr:T9SS type A sorting domain-containing protein [Bacteroidota bacterium]
MKKILYSFFFLLGIFQINAQSIEWTKLFDIHSINSLGGLSTNSIIDNENIITPVVEQDTLKLYKLDATGTIIESYNTNFNCGQITNALKISSDNYVVIFNNTPQDVSESYKIMYFNAQLDVISIYDLAFPFTSNLNRILSFFKINNQLYITVNAFSSINYYLLEINSSNQLIEKYSSSDSISKDHINVLNSGNIVIDFNENQYHALKCVNPSTGQLIWQENYSSSDYINLNYIKTLDNQDNIYLAHQVREWDNLGIPFDTIFLKKINGNTGMLIENSSFNPVTNCAIRIEDIQFNAFTNSFYLTYLDCDINPKLHLQQYNSSLQFINELIINAPNNPNSSSDTFFKSKLKIKNDGSLVFIYRKYKDSNELENIYISNLTSNLSALNTTELNITPKNGDEIETDIQLYNDSQLVITGFIPNVNPSIFWEEVQYFVSMINLDGTLENIVFDNDFSITIYPNPTQNILNINTQETIKEVSVYDMLGKKVNTNQVSNNTLNVSNLAQGFYFIKIIGENDKTFSTKFIKE